KLPGGIFSRAFVRSYAVEVGLDPDETVNEFLERFKQEPPPSAEALAAAIPEQERLFEAQQRRAAQRLGIAVGLVILLVVAGDFTWRWRGAQKSSAAPSDPMAATSGSTAVSSAPDPAAPPAPPPPAPDTAAPSASGSGAPAAAPFTLDVH